MHVADFCVAAQYYRRRCPTITRHMPTTRLVRAMAALCAALGLAGLAEAQDLSASARYGAVTLESDFRTHPHVVNVESGGPDAASSHGSGCTGYISNESAAFELT